MMDELLQRFLDQAPVAVMTHATLARTLGDPTLDDLFERQARDQYTRDLTFSTVTRLMTQVVFRAYPSVHAAYRGDHQIPVSITSVYNKLNGLEPGVAPAGPATADPRRELPGRHRPPPGLPARLRRRCPARHGAGGPRRRHRTADCDRAL
jgi:hypothetical protein